MRRTTLLPLLLFATALLPLPASTEGPLNDEACERIIEALVDLERTHSVLITHDGEPILEHDVAGPALDEPANIKSVAKAVMSALVGAAIHHGVIEGPDQPVVELLGDALPADADPRIAEITVGHLLSMQAGLERTSGANYGAWVSSNDWVADALTRPFVDEPGGRMLYSTGNSHILSAALTHATGRSTLELAREWLGNPLNIRIPAWDTDPQGIFFGGNNMLLSPRALARIGELYHHDGELNGNRILAADWVETSWQPRTRSRFTGDAYGMGWFTTELAGETVRYGWGYGGQFLHVIPDLGVTIVILSDPTPPAERSAHLRRVHTVIEQKIIPELPDTRPAL